LKYININIITSILIRENSNKIFFINIYKEIRFDIFLETIPKK